MKTMGCLLMIVALGLAGGCATTPRVDWDSRIGNFTYDQAVSQLGQPAHHEVKADGTQSAEWITERGNPGSVGFGMGAAYATPGMLDSRPLPSVDIRTGWETDPVAAVLSVVVSPSKKWQQARF